MLGGFVSGRKNTRSVTDDDAVVSLFVSSVEADRGKGAEDRIVTYCHGLSDKQKLFTGIFFVSSVKADRGKGAEDRIVTYCHGLSDKQKLFTGIFFNVDRIAFAVTQEMISKQLKIFDFFV